MKLKIKGLSYSYDNSRMIFKDFVGNLDLRNLNVIIGKNGIGKTTMLDIISGLIRTRTGQISGVPKQKDIMYVFQSVPFFTDVKVSQLIKMYDSFTSKNSFEVKNIANSKTFYNDNIKTLLPLRLGVLSGGEVKLVFDYASAMVLKSLYLFDEPLSGVDVENQEKIVSFLEEFALKYPVIITSHEIDVFKNINCTLNYITRSGFIFSGSYDDLINEAGSTSEAAFLNLTQKMRMDE